MSAVLEEPQYTPAELASMTKEERDAIGVVLDDDKPLEKVEQGEPGSPEAVAAAEAAKVVAAAPAVVVPAAEVVPAVVAAPVVVAAPAVAAAVAAPVVGAIADAADPIPAGRVARAPVVESITDETHAAAQSALSKKFEDGEVTTPQFIIENDKLTRAKIAADAAASSSVLDEASTWQARQEAFFSVQGNAIIRDDARVWAAMQAQLEAMYIDPKCKEYSDMQFLNEAGREVRKLFGLEVAPAAAAPVVAAKPGSALASVPLPKTLGEVPAAAENTDGGEFAHMDKLEGMDYETAVARMTADQRARFLA